MLTTQGGECGGDGTCLQWASGRWVAVCSRFFECTSSAVQQVERRVLPIARPPHARCLQKNVRPQGTAEGWAAESRIRAANDCPSPHLPCTRARGLQQEPPNFSCPPAARSVPTQLLTGPARKRAGLMRTEAGAGGGAWAREPRGTSAWLSRRDVASGAPPSALSVVRRCAGMFVAREGK